MSATLDDSFFDYQFAVIRDPRVNAFAVPGGYVYVNSGLLAQVNNEDELAAVLGHEIGHVHAHHVVRQQEATQALNYAALLGTLLSRRPAGRRRAGHAPRPPPSRCSTSASSSKRPTTWARAICKSTGYDPRAMLDFFKQLVR